VRRGRVRAVHFAGRRFGEVMEIEVLETARLVGTPIRDAKLPEGVIIGAMVRGGKGHHRHRRHRGGAGPTMSCCSRQQGRARGRALVSVRFGVF
jgi:hypothetical protein